MSSVYHIIDTDDGFNFIATYAQRELADAHVAWLNVGRNERDGLYEVEECEVVDALPDYVAQNLSPFQIRVDESGAIVRADVYPPGAFDVYSEMFESDYLNGHRFMGVFQLFARDMADAIALVTSRIDAAKANGEWARIVADVVERHSARIASMRKSFKTVPLETVPLEASTDDDDAGYAGEISLRA